jgi:hypothetical protein
MIASHTPVEIAHANQINMVKLSSTGTWNSTIKAVSLMGSTVLQLARLTQIRTAMTPTERTKQRLMNFHHHTKLPYICIKMASFTNDIDN